MTFFDRHATRLTGAIDAVRDRRSWTAFADQPARHPLGADGARAGADSYAALLGSRFPLEQPGPRVEQRAEISPYTGAGLEITYPRTDPERLLAAAEAAGAVWARAEVATRVGVGLEILERLYQRSFELQAASVHTTGQPAGMAYTGNGTNALDRGLEALAQAHLAMTRVAPDAVWDRQFGSASSRLHKRYALVPRGVAVAIACASFPAWNTYPAILASLVTGNAVIVKPHPSSVLTLAIAVQTCRTVLAEAGFPPDLVSLAVDGPDEPVTQALVEDPRCAIVDFTGGPGFGRWLERNLPGRLVFTETAGVNSVVLESVADLEAAARALAGGLCLFSAQMCTSPQNIYVPQGGVLTAAGRASYADVVDAIVAGVAQIADRPTRAAALLGAIQAPGTVDIQDDVAARVGAHGRRLRAGSAYEHPEYPAARTRTPLLAEVDPDSDLVGTEQFGPNAFVLQVPDAATGAARAAVAARTRGSIAAYVYSIDEDFLTRTEDAFVAVGVNVTANALGPMPMNFSAAYSDYHVTGLNPAGTATLTDEAFVSGRFRVVQTRRQL